MSSGEKLLLTAFGATGQQGGSIIRTVLSDVELSEKYRLRGLTRDPSGAAALALQSQGVEIARVDVSDCDVASIASALHGSDVVFALTITDYATDTYKTELSQGKSIADAAVAAGVGYLIFSTLPHVSKISGGKYTKAAGFDSKAEVEAYIRGLGTEKNLIKSAFFAPGTFMQNFQHMMAPRPVGDGTYAITGIVTPETELPLIDIVDDTGKYVGAILADLDKYEGTILSAATKLLSMTEIAEQLGNAVGKAVNYKQLPVNVYQSFLPPNAADQLVEMFRHIQDNGYYGPQSKEELEWTGQQVHGKLTTFDQYLAKHPIHID